MSDYWHRKDPMEGEYQQRFFVNLDRRRPYITYILLGLNILAYLIMTLAGYIYQLNQGEQLILFGAKVNILIAYGQYWRLLTAMFLHIGIVHLFFNSYALYIYGPIVESLFGKAKFLVVYIVSGLTGSLLSYMFSLSISAGASGAIFGLMGSLLYLRQRNRDIFQRVFGSRLFVIIGFNLFYGFTSTGIDNWGHIGGLVGGYLVANAIGLYKEPILQFKKVIIWILLFLLFVFGIRYGEGKYMVETKPRPSIPTQGESIKTGNSYKINYTYNR
ncbi:MAG: rhomboid family intramembrane serine protease [Clostridiales bacterium]|nr:rhomboid family intramembrane serine protease [Clostridiales bacterium]